MSLIKKNSAHERAMADTPTGQKPRTPKKPREPNPAFAAGAALERTASCEALEPFAKAAEKKKQRKCQAKVELVAE